MSYTFLLEQGGESSAECFSDIPASVLSRLSLTAEKSSSSGNGTESCPSSQSGTTYEPSMDHHGGDWLMLSAGASRVRTSAQQAKEQGLTANAPGSGGRWYELSVRYDRVTSSWKTHHCLWEEDLDVSLVTWPRWGMMRDGACLGRSMQGLHISARESGLVPNGTTFHHTPTTSTDGGSNSRKALKKRLSYPTPTVCGEYNRKGASATSGNGLATVLGGPPNPTWKEWLMGWPMGWTDLEPLETAKFQQWLHSHGKPSPET